MKKYFLYIIALTITFISMPVMAYDVAITAPAVQTSATDKTSEAEIQKVFSNWFAAISTVNAENVNNLYASDAVLLPTLSPVVSNTPELRLAYFKKFTALQNLQGKVVESHIRIYGDIAINSGLYNFTFIKNGQPQLVVARYSFVYHRTPQGWLIVDHHSSKLPIQE